jgi:hypothetical protein
MYDRDDREEEPERRSLSLRMWSTRDRRPSRGSLNVTNSLRMFKTSDGSGGNLRVTQIKVKPQPTPREVEKIERTWKYAAEAAENLRTGAWTAPWAPAPQPGTVKEARERQKRTRFRPGSEKAKKAGARGGRMSTTQRRAGQAKSLRKTLAARRNARLGGRPRKAPAPPTSPPSSPGAA